MSEGKNQERGLTVHGAGVLGPDGWPLFKALRLGGREAVNELFEYQLLVQTPRPEAELVLDEWLGRELSCRIELEGQGGAAGEPGGPGGSGEPGVREINGLVTQARFVREDERHALYEFTLRPWAYLATLRSDCKVFQDLTPVQVIAQVLADYPYALQWRLIESYPVRDYTVQYNETDWQFIERLLQTWGINHHFEHSQGVHRLVLSDHNGAFAPLQGEQGDSGYGRIPYYPPGHKIDREYIHAFEPERRLGARQYSSAEHDYTRPALSLQAQARQGQEGQGAQSGQGGQGGQSGQSAGANPGASEQAGAPTAAAAAVAADVYLWRAGQRIGQGEGQVLLAGSHWSQPNAGVDRQANDKSQAQGQLQARLRLQALRQGTQRARGGGHLRGMAAGCSFLLEGHPLAEANGEYLILATQTLLESPSQSSQRAAVPQAQAGSAGAGVGVGAGELSGQWRCSVDFEVQPSGQLLRPQALQAPPVIAGPETAVVCGPQGPQGQGQVYTDELGRIKVQFFWDRHGPHNQASSCWVRVSQAWAGNQLGAMHLPRVGQEVIVSFLGGDIERPICTGRLYHQDNLPPWQLPQQQALSGLRSRELKPGQGNSAAGRSNHLLLDDTEGQIQAQLHSDHAHASLSLGHITRVHEHAGRQDHRGEGFELRSDAHGALRAEQGLLLSTQGRAQAQGHMLDMAESKQRLAQAQAQHQSLGELAQGLAAQEGQQLQVAQALQAQNQAIEGQGTGQGQGQGQGKWPELNQPHLVLTSAAGLVSSAEGSTHQHSGEHHAITSEGHSSISAGQSLLASARQAVRLLAYKAGMKLVAAGGNIELQALQQSVNILARLNITQTATRIEIKALQELVINGGGSYTKLNPTGITHGTMGPWVAQAAMHRMLGPTSEPVVPPVFPPNPGL